MNEPILDVSYTWNHTLFGLLCLASYTYYHVFEVHLWRSTYQHFIPPYWEYYPSVWTEHNLSIHQFVDISMLLTLWISPFLKLPYHDSVFLSLSWSFLLFPSGFLSVSFTSTFPLRVGFPKIWSIGHMSIKCVLFKKKNKFIYLFIWLHWVFVAARGPSLVGVSGGYSLFRCAGFSLQWRFLLPSTGSRHARFSSCGLWALERRLSSCGAWA